MRFHARREGNLLFLSEIKNYMNWITNSWSCTCCYSVCFENNAEYIYGEKCHIFTDHESLKYLGTQRELNRRKRRWLELMKNYDCTIDYLPCKDNVVVDALSWKSFSSVSLSPWTLLLELRAMNVCLHLIQMVQLSLICK